MEEDVPTVGDDWDYNGAGLGIGLGNMTLDSMQNFQAPKFPNLALQGNPVDMSQFDVPAPAVQGLGILSIPEENVDETNMSPMPQSQLSNAMPSQISVPFNFMDDCMDDDLYFDDGMIDEVNFDESERFDESVLDDPSHPLYERKPKEPKEPTAVEQLAVIPSEVDDVDVDLDHAAFESNVTVFNFGPQNPVATPEALAEYHSILAMATTKAAEAGRFERQDVTEASKSPEPADTTREASSQPSLIQDDSHSSPISQASPTSVAKAEQGDDAAARRGSEKSAVFTLGSGYDTYESNYMAYASDLSDYDSALEDDNIIAAANADALANDDDGIYGSEFGFYARPDTGDEGVFQNGGYFGPKEWSDIKRQKSTREPNLTPITERSEYSTRNSFINVSGMDKDRSQPSPGLAQLARMSPSAWDGDMSMEALMKLRRGAFGGSQASLGSFGSGRDAPSSPLVSSPIIAIQEARNSAYGNDKRASAISQRSIFVAPIVTAPNGRTSSDQDWEDASSVTESDYTSTEEVEDEDDYYYDEGDDDFDSPVVTAAMAESIASSSLPRKSFSRPFNHSLISPPGTEALESQWQFPSSFSPPPHNSTSPMSPLSPTPSLNPTLQPSSIDIVTAATHLPPHIHLQTPAKRNSHSRSGSDTVAYVQEQDDGETEPHWVLERRRTGDDGIEEVIGRTRIENGMI